MVNKSIKDIENSELFKYSPYKALSEEQQKTVYQLLNDIIDINNNSYNNSTSKSVIQVLGGAGTGKTIIAVYLVKLLKDLIDKKKTWEFLDDEEESWVLRNISKNIGGINKIGFVVPMEKLRNTMKTIFASIDGLNPSMVLSPEEVTKSRYDLLVVDEVHRLYRRKFIPQNQNKYDIIDSINAKLMPAGTQTGTESDYSELDWIIQCSRIKILFFDEYQTIRVADIGKERFEKTCDSITYRKYELHSQMRCNGGTGYYEYIKKILEGTNIIKEKNFRKKITNYDIKIFNSFDELRKAIEENKDDLCDIMTGPAWRINDSITIENQSFSWEGDSPEKKDNKTISSIHKTQGFDKNYAGVVLSKEIIYNEEENRVSIDKKNLKDKFMVEAKDFEGTRQRVLNLYLTLLTRGIKGTYIYAMDDKLRDYLKNFFEE